MSERVSAEEEEAQFRQCRLPGQSAEMVKAGGEISLEMEGRTHRGFDATEPAPDQHWQVLSSVETYIVYNTTPTGSKKQAAAVGTPVRLLATALPPVNSMAVTRMLVMRPKTMKTI